MAEVTKLYKITLPTSDRESKHIGYFINEQVGLQSVKNQGYYNCSGDSSALKVVQLLDGNYGVISRIIEKPYVNTANNVDDVIKQRAIDKLTKEERRVLGLS